MIKRLDVVRILTTERIKWVSGPAGRPASPKGEWSVAGANGNLLLLSKDETIIQVPYNDVVKVAEYDISRVIENVKRVTRMSDIQGEKNESSEGPEETCEEI
jgi:hypothetical protein